MTDNTMNTDKLFTIIIYNQLQTAELLKFTILRAMKSSKMYEFA